MPRPIWKGHISFGLVSIPVAVFPAESKDELHFHLLDRRNMARIRYQRVNEATGEETPNEDIVRGYEYEEGNYVVVEDEDFKKASVEATQSVDLEDFVDEKAIDYVYFDKPYYLVPDKKGEKGYVLLREALKQRKKAGIAKVVIHTRQYLAAVIAQGDALVLNLLRFHHELRPLKEFEFPGAGLKQYKVSDREIRMAEQLVDSMADKWKPEKYRDEYRDVLLKWIEKKARQGEMAAAPQAEEEAEAPRHARVVDMMDLLKKSLREKGRHAEPAAVKKAAAQRQKRKAA